jgi:hypothetical protein
MRYFLYALLLSAATLAGAQVKGTIDFTQPLHGLDGKPILLTAEKNSPAATLGDVAVNALESVTDQDRGLTGQVKFQRDELARHIYGNKHAVLSIEDVSLIKDRIGQVYGPLVVGAAWPLLDPSMKAEN